MAFRATIQPLPVLDSSSTALRPDEKRRIAAGEADGLREGRLLSPGGDRLGKFGLDDTPFLTQLAEQLKADFIYAKTCRLDALKEKYVAQLTPPS